MRQILILLIKAYQHLFLLHRIPPHCKYCPSCSEYTILAVKKYGAFFGLTKGLWRIVRCNPLSKGGVDIP